MRAVKTEAVLLVCLRPTACSVLWLMADVGMYLGHLGWTTPCRAQSTDRKGCRNLKTPPEVKDPPNPIQDRVD